MHSLTDKQAVKSNKNIALSAFMNTAKHNINKKDNIAYKGKNIGIAILDTGISPVEDFTLPYNRIFAFRDFVGNKIAPYDDNGHGTHPSYYFLLLLLSNIFCTS